jgi:hypothetical protein
MKKYKTQVGEKILVVSKRQLKNISSIVNKINAAGKNVGSGHDLQKLTENDDGTYTLVLVSYGGPTWSFNFEIENAY